MPKTSTNSGDMQICGSIFFSGVEINTGTTTIIQKNKTTDVRRTDDTGSLFTHKNDRAIHVREVVNNHFLSLWLVIRLW